MAYTQPTNPNQINQTNTHQSNTITPEEQELIITGTHIGLQLITKKSIGWPLDGQVRIQNIKEGILNSTCKWSYTDNSYNDEEVYQYLIRNAITLDNCWYTTEDSRFNKMRNGLNTERTPPPK
ncbi:hypothetical protein E2C01_064253 [Portunus trituberculatus]|uniref:Uncharacterized protein n=1 Tax=Portunus trituberculatus TaxID=210409 RepID=A0A5B7HMR5_PORTR|nr:hypothetical protein [Portunus trituberculatus]